MGAVAAILIWSAAPINVDRDRPDPAVLFANDRSASEPAFQEGFFDVGGEILHYVEAGEGETILFLHGFPSFWLSLGQQMEHLKTDYHVIAVDGLGVGRSSVARAVDAYTLENLTAQISALLDAKATGKVHLVGHDWGAALALGFAQRYPERVRTVTAMSAPSQTVLLELISSGPPEADRFSYVEHFKRANPLFIYALGVPDQIYQGAYQPMMSSGAMSAEEGDLFRKALSNPKRINAHINWYRANIPHPDEIEPTSFWPKRGAQIDAPLLFIWGQDDPIISPKAVSFIEYIGDDVTLLSFSDTGHWPHVERRAEVNDAIADFLDAADAP